jgi:hypothetical protein
MPFCVIELEASQLHLPGLATLSDGALSNCSLCHIPDAKKLKVFGGNFLHCKKFYVYCSVSPSGTWEQVWLVCGVWFGTQ